MNTAEVGTKQPLIFSAIAGVMRDVGVVAKEKEFESPIGKKGNYMFRGIDDVMNALHPAMVNNKIFVVPEILEQVRESRVSKSGTQMQVSICKIRYTFYAEDGSSVAATVIGEGMDTGDKATNKAMSIAFKYACFQVFCIPTEEMSDPDSERPELEGDDKKTGKSNKAKKTSQKDENKKADDSVASSTITEAMLTTLKAEQKRTGVTDNQILGMKSVSAKTLNELSVQEFKVVMDKFKKTPDLPGGVKNE